MSIFKEINTERGASVKVNETMVIVSLNNIIVTCSKKDVSLMHFTGGGRDSGYTMDCKTVVTVGLELEEMQKVSEVLGLEVQEMVRGVQVGERIARGVGEALSR